MIFQSFFKGLLAILALLGVYFTVLTLVSGWEFAQNQFLSFWYFISYLKSAAYHQKVSGKIVAVSGTTSTAAMIS